jgi:A/G-specific adenine glycosylase
MNRKRHQKLQWFEGVLHDFFRRAGREHLPWRKKGIGAYEVWVSEIMLQQTQVSRVIEYYNRFLKRFPTVESLAQTTWEEFLPYYAGLGYYARGRNMLRAAKAVASEHGGRFPKDIEALRKLPGVGPYTASAIASFAYGRDTIAWDTNLRRVIGRFFFGSKYADIPFDEFESAFSLPARELNAALMDFGSAICTGRPKCGACPIRDKCLYLKTGGKMELSDGKQKRAVSRKAQSPNSKNQTNSKFKIQNSKLERQRWKDAQVMLTLHERHKIYYSSKKRSYAPFSIPASHNTRAGIKDWFREKYDLELSVRPPHDRRIIDGKPTLLVNAQILLGEAGFAVFRKDEKGNERG